MSVSEFRKHPISEEWVVVATGRSKRPHRFAKKKNKPTPKKGCPFEDFGTASHVEPLLVLSRGGTELVGARARKDWFVQVVPNKFPAFTPETGVENTKFGPFDIRSGFGYHEVLIMREHTRHWANYTPRETATIFKAYHMRYTELASKKGVKYVSIFHNFGPDAGASIYHPHSQMMAIPVVPRDVRRSFKGSERYFKENGRFAHRDLINFELRKGERIVYENDSMIAFCPYVPRATFEVRIFPKRRKADFAQASEHELADAGDALHRVLKALSEKLGNPSFNFFFHTAHCEDTVCNAHYHWHIEIFPKVSIWAGFEIGTGIEISTVAPKDAAKILRGGRRFKKRS